MLSMKEHNCYSRNVEQGPGQEILLVILGGGSLCGSSPNPDPISVKKNAFFLHPFSDLASKIHTCFPTSPGEFL